jgi:hypothetical protein
MISKQDVEGNERMSKSQLKGYTGRGLREWRMEKKHREV